MFYKLTDSKNNIITVSNIVKFYRYLPSTYLLSECSEEIAQACSLGSSSRVYDIQKGYPSGYHIEKLSENELKYFESYIDRDAPEVLARSRDKKIQELSSKCKSLITKGLPINFLDGHSEHFELTLEDQANLNRIMNLQLIDHKSAIIYHSSNQQVRKFSASEFKQIYMETSKFINYHTTYFNLIKNRINSMNSVAQIEAVCYGDMPFDAATIQLLNSLRGL